MFLSILRLFYTIIVQLYVILLVISSYN